MVWLQGLGPLGTVALVALAGLGWFLSQAQNIDTIRKWLPSRSGRSAAPRAPEGDRSDEQKPVAPAPAVVVNGSNNQVLQGVQVGRDLVLGDKIQGDKVAGDKVSGTKIVADHVVIQQAPPPAAPPPHGSLHNLRTASIGELLKGRGPLMARLQAALGPVPQQAGAVPAAVALVGQGGWGKSRVAIEHAWAQLACHSAVLLIGAGSAASITANLARLCGPDALNLPEQAEREEALQRQAVLRWLREHPGWLLILDGIDAEDGARAAEEMLPQLSGGQLLLTSRLQRWSPAIETLAVDLLEPDEAAAFLLERTEGRRRAGPHDAVLALGLAQDLGHLALALEQAGAYIHTRRCSLRDYQSAWQSSRAAVLAWKDPRLSQYPESVASTWLTSFEQLSDAARTLLRRLAWLAPEPIPESLLAVPTPGETALAEGGLDALVELEGFSLVNRSTEAEAPPTLAVHRLVQEVLRLRQQGEERSDLGATLAWVNAAFVGDPQDVRSWRVLDPLAAHAMAVASYADEARIEGPTARLLSQLGGLYLSKSQTQTAEPLMRRALAINEASYGSEHPNVAIRLNNLASLLQATNRLAEAEPLMRRALAIDEASYGNDHPTVAIRLNNLAQLLKATNRLAEAEPLMRRALAIDEASYGNDHPNVAIRLNNLAQLLKATNRLEEAEPLMRRALAIHVASYGNDHPNVARDLNNLASLLQATNRLAEAEPLMRRALAIDEASYGNDHPTVAIRLNNLALLLQATNRTAEAELLMRRGLEILITSGQQGYQHPNLQAGLSNYKRLLDGMGLSQDIIQTKLNALQSSS